jgi:predicted metal-dependent enzyme (double-stranded beta helix superfamily)
MEAALQSFIAEVKQILAEDGPSPAGLERIATRMQAFIRQPEVLAAHEEVAGNFHTGRRGPGPVYADDTGLTLMRARFGPETMTPIHNHGSWGVVGVYRGRDRYQVWRRLDDGSQPGHARVELVDERVLGPGDVMVMPPPPQDVHAQQGADGQPAYEFVLFGRNAGRLPRLYFDPERGTTREVSPSQR